MLLHGKIWVIVINKGDRSEYRKCAEASDLRSLWVDGIIVWEGFHVPWIPRAAYRT